MEGAPGTQEKCWQRPVIKPRRLAPGDRVAIVTPCWGGAGAFPHRYEAGKAYLEKNIGVEAVEMPNALRPAAWIEENPQARADDLHQSCSTRPSKRDRLLAAFSAGSGIMRSRAFSRGLPAF